MFHVQYKSQTLRHYGIKKYRYRVQKEKKQQAYTQQAEQTISRNLQLNVPPFQISLKLTTHRQSGKVFLNSWCILWPQDETKIFLETPTVPRTMTNSTKKAQGEKCIVSLIFHENFKEKKFLGYCIFVTQVKIDIQLFLAILCFLCINIVIQSSQMI